MCELGVVERTLWIECDARCRRGRRWRGTWKFQLPARGGAGLRSVVRVHASALPQISVLERFPRRGRAKSGPDARQTGTRQPYNGGVGSAGRALRSDPRSPEVNSSLQGGSGQRAPHARTMLEGKCAVDIRTRESHWRELQKRRRRVGFGELGDAQRNCSFANLLLLQVAESGREKGARRGRPQQRIRGVCRLECRSWQAAARRAPCRRPTVDRGGVESRSRRIQSAVMDA